MARSGAAAVAPPPAKRRKPAAKSRTHHASTQTHRRPERRSSGPATGRPTARKRSVAAAEARAASVAVPNPRTTTAPRRASRSRAGAATTTVRPRRHPGAAPLVQRLIHGRAGALADRLLRGRACMAIVFALLVGIVFFNVSLLKLNEGIARTEARATAIEQKNAKLRRQVAPLASSERIQREAVKRGYSLPAAGDVGYIRGSVSSNAKKATARMAAPGTGEGTASRTSAQVQEEAATSPTAPVAAVQTQAPATTPPPATPPPANPTAPAAAIAP